MKLPNAHQATVPERKITEYLLNPARPDGAGKAQFFGQMGYRREDWQILASALRKLAAHGEITESLESRHGWKYVLDGHLETPTGRKPLVRTVWVVDAGTAIPRLVTAYPREEQL